MRKTLANGITMRTSRIDNSESVCFILKLSFGSYCEPKELKGITHLTEHLCFRRNNGMCQADFYYEIEKIGGYLRGITYRDCVIFEITVLKKYFSLALRIIRGLFEDNEWTREDIRKEKAVVLREIENSCDFKYKQLMYDFFCKNFAGDDILGTKSKILKCTMENIADWKSKLFSTKHTEIIAVGNLSEREENEIADTFSSIPFSEIGAQNFKPQHFLERSNEDSYYYEDATDTFAVSLAFDVDMSKVRREVAEVVHSTLFCGLLSPFSMQLRETEGLVDEITNGYSFYNFGGMMYLVFETTSDKSEKLSFSLEKLFSEQRESLSLRSFECAKAAFCDRMRALHFTPVDFAYILAFDASVDSPEQFIGRNSRVTYEEACIATKEIFKKENTTINIYNSKGV